MISSISSGCVPCTALRQDAILMVASRESILLRRQRGIKETPRGECTVQTDRSNFAIFLLFMTVKYEVSPSTRSRSPEWKMNDTLLSIYSRSKRLDPFNYYYLPVLYTLSLIGGQKELALNQMVIFIGSWCNDGNWYFDESRATL